MIIKKIKLRSQSQEDIQKFCHATSGCCYDIDLVSGRYVIDAKSILGVFSLSFEKPVEMYINVDTEEDCASLLVQIKQFLC